MNPLIRDRRRTRRVERAVEGTIKQTTIVGMQNKDLEWKPPKGLRVRINTVVELAEAPAPIEVAAPPMMTPLDLARFVMRRAPVDELRLDTAI